MVQLHEFLVPVLNELATAEGFADGFTLTTTTTGAGDGFMGLLLRVNIEGLRNGTDSNLPVVVKMPPDSPERRAQFSAVPIFEREALFYEKYWPMLMQFQRERGITKESDGFFSVPKCYKVISDAENENYAIIMEDLVTNGFRMFDKMATIDLAHVTVFVRNLARYHAISFAIRDQQPELFDEIRKLRDIFNETMIKKNAHFEPMIGYAIEKAIKSLTPAEEFRIEKMQKLKAEAMTTFENCASHEKCEQFGVLMHGDCWNNNMMYGYGEDNSPNNIRLLDFQLLRYGSPANDLAYFLFTSTDEELRSQHYENILEIYHQTLTEFVTKLGSDGKTLYSFKDFKKQMKQFGRYGLLMAVLVVQIISVDKKDLPDMDKMAKDIAENKINLADTTMMDMGGNDAEKKYNKRISGVIRDVIRLGYY